MSDIPPPPGPPLEPPASQPPPEPEALPEGDSGGTKAWWKRGWAIALWVVLGIVILALLVPDPEDDADPEAAESTADAVEEGSGEEDPPTASSTETVESTTTVETTTTTVATTEAPTTTLEETTTTVDEIAIIDAGTYVVGSEVPAGAYRVVNYWALLDGNQEIIDNDFVGGDGMSLVVITEVAKFVEFSGEAASVEEIPSLDPIAAGFNSGTYLVGPDIAPGVYRVSNPGELAYAARLDSGLGIIDNAATENSVILTVSESDFAFRFNGTLELVPE